MAETTKGAFSLHWVSGLLRTGRSRRMSYPQQWSEKASSVPPRMVSRMLSRTLGRLAPRDNESDVQLINQSNGLPRSI